MKRFAATVGVFALAASALSSAAWAPGAAAPAKTDPKAETKSTATMPDTKGTATTPAPSKADAKSAATAAPTTTPAPAKAATPATPAKAAEKKHGAKVDLNTASAADLKAAGFSDDEAKKIIDGRPWTRKDELVKKNVMSEDAYKKVKDGVVAHQMKAEAKKK